MANELQVIQGTSRTVYFVIRNTVGLVWNTGTSAFESYSLANYANYVIQATEQGTTGLYAGTFPTAITTPGLYNIVAVLQAGGSPAATDGSFGSGELTWTGTSVNSLAGVASSGQISQISPIKMARGVMILNFPFKLVSSVDHITPFTSGVVSGQISKDGAAFGALQSGAYSEIGNGFYSLQAFTSGDLNANTVAVTFTASQISGGGNSDPRDFSFILQKVSGY